MPNYQGVWSTSEQYQAKGQNNWYILQGQSAYTTPGTYSWVAPVGVTSVCVVCVGAGGGSLSGAGGGGGELRYKNNITVSPGTAYTVVVGAPDAVNTNPNGSAGSSSFNTTTCVANGGVNAASGSSTQAGGSGGTGDGGGNGGSGAGAASSYGSGGGAGGYSGNGGNGGGSNNHTAGTGGAGGGGASYINSLYLVAFGGGGVGILGQGTSQPKVATTANINGGSGGADGGTSPPVGGLYGGGAGAADGTALNNQPGAGGAVRIIWGVNRAFPSTNTGNL